MNKKYSVTGMTCAACSSGIERTVSKLDGVSSCSVSLMGESMDVTFDESKLSDGDIRADMQAAVESGKAETDAETISIGGRECIRVLERVGTRELWVGGYVSTSVLRSASLPFWLWQVILTAFLLLEMFLFLYIIRKMISQPINRFVTAAQNLEAEGVFQLSDQPADNMDFLYQAFVGVSAKLKATLEQTYKSKLLAYQSEIKFL